MSLFGDLLRRAKEGDEQAVERLLVPYLPALTAFVRLRLNQQILRRESSSDIVQSVCREVIGDLDAVRATGEGAFRAWLFGIAYNKLRNKHDYHHAAKRDISKELRCTIDFGIGEEALLVTYGQAATPSQDVAAAEEVARIEAAFAKLPPLYAEVLLHVGIAGLSYSEAGRLVDRSEDAVRQLVHRARARLASLLD